MTTVLASIPQAAPSAAPARLRTVEPATGGASTSSRRHPARWRRRSDPKIDLLASIPSLKPARRSDLAALSAAVDVVRAEPGEVLAVGPDLPRYWWMPVEGWLVMDEPGCPVLTVPAGRSWTAKRASHPLGELSSVRGGRVLVTSGPRLWGTVDEHPSLGDLLAPTIVRGDV